MLYNVSFTLQNNIRAEDCHQILDGDWPHVRRTFVDMECSVYSVPAKKACLDDRESNESEVEWTDPLTHMSDRGSRVTPTVAGGMDDSDIALEKALMILDLGDDDESSDSEVEQEVDVPKRLSLPSTSYMANPAYGVRGAGSLQHSGSEDSASLSSFSTE